MSTQHDVSSLHSATHGANSSVSSFWVLLSVGLLYISFGVCFGLLEYSVPPILMTRGVNLQSMGWVIALYIPFGLTFLWAPIVDSRPLPWLSYRIGWIAVCQIISSLLLTVVAFGADFPASVLFTLGLMICFAVATMDLALDALAVDSIGSRYRAIAAGLKVGALALGGFIGGGVLLGLFSCLGWKGVFLVTAALPLLTILPILTLTRADKQRSAASKRASIMATFHRPGALKQLGMLSVTTTAIIALFYFQRPILVEMGVPLEHIGWTLGTLSPVLNTLAAVGIVPLLARSSPVRILFVLVAVSGFAALGTTLSVEHKLTNVVIFWAIVQGMGCSALSVIIYALILKWAATDQSATDYAVLCGGSRLLVTLILMAVPTLLTHVSWGVFYTCCMFVLVIFSLILKDDVKKIAI